MRQQKETGIDYVSYLKLIGGCMMVSPLVFGVMAVDHGNEKGLLYTFIMYVVLILIAIAMFNYLETGNMFKASRKINR